MCHFSILTMWDTNFSFMKQSHLSHYGNCMWKEVKQNKMYKSFGITYGSMLWTRLTWTTLYTVSIDTFYFPKYQRLQRMSNLDIKHYWCKKCFLKTQPRYFLALTTVLWYNYIVDVTSMCHLCYICNAPQFNFNVTCMVFLVFGHLKKGAYKNRLKVCS